ncbi:hypothetical protein BJY00DRAFT_273437 [Aspergillus carlsbadensis]|nr:hypothetical protein BJY00DRAFT_273437 [Aspergillus carlsbadensis]
MFTLPPHIHCLCKVAAVGRQRHRIKSTVSRVSCLKNKTDETDVHNYSNGKGGAPVIDILESSYCLHCDGLIVSMLTIDGSTCYVHPQYAVAQEQLATLMFLRNLEACRMAFSGWRKPDSDLSRCLAKLELHVIRREPGSFAPVPSNFVPVES